ncbi:hypothetical protein C8J56DRAFT_968837 [Mycena floridula]|nr:hypothetical protein C8J56DRAFT_968837 [Mycena floridula]
MVALAQGISTESLAGPSHIMVSRFSFLLLFLLGFHCHALAKLVNITIDDTLGDPSTGAQIVYYPADAWHTNDTCGGDCQGTPNSKDAYSKTWHGSTFDVNKPTYPNTILQATASFSGSAVYVYCVLPFNRTRGPPSNMTFLVDGKRVGAFVQDVNSPNPADGSQFGFNSLVFSTTNLSDTAHTLTLQNGHVDGPKSQVILDYITYSTNDNDSTARIPSDNLSKHPNRTAAIIGGIVGTVAFIGILAGFVLWRRKRSKWNLIPDGERAIEPFHLPEPQPPSYQASELSRGGPWSITDGSGGSGPSKHGGNASY